MFTKVKRLLSGFLSWFRFKRNQYIFDHYVLPCFTVEELSKHSFEKLGNFYFFFTGVEFVPNTQRLFFKRLKKGQILLILYDESSISEIVATLILNKSSKVSKDEIEETKKKMKEEIYKQNVQLKKIKDRNRKQKSRDNKKTNFDKISSDINKLDLSKLEDVETLLDDLKELKLNIEKELQEGG